MFLRPLLDLFFPPLCHVCRVYIPDLPPDDESPLHICPECLDKITFITSPLCNVCGKPFFSEAPDNHTCGACLTDAPHHTSRSAAVLGGPIQQLIHSFKYGGRVHLAHPLGILASSTLRGFCAVAAPDLILPVPLHRKRLRQRGYNQSQLIGAVLAKQWKVPLEVGNLRRLRWTEPQTALDARDRATNVKGAFGVKDPKRLEGKRVLLVDDVVTTGSTVRACVDALREVDVAAVCAVTVARGIQQ